MIFAESRVLSRTYPIVRLLDYMMILFLTFREKNRLSPHSPMIYLPRNCVGFQIYHIIITICFSLFCIMPLDQHAMVLQSWFSFLPYSVSLVIFQMCDSSLDLPLVKCLSKPLVHFLLWVLCFCSALEVLYICQILIRYTCIFVAVFCPPTGCPLLSWVFPVPGKSY